MVSRKRTTPASSSPRATRSSTRTASQSAARRIAPGRDAAVPDIYRQMVAEARAEIRSQDDGVSERPLKRRRPGERAPARTTTPATSAAKAASGVPDNEVAGASSVDDAQFEFEDALLPKPTVQTITRSDDDEDEDDDIDFEDVAIEPSAPSAVVTSGGSQELKLDLSAHMAAMVPRRPDRRKAMSREEKERRIQVHKIHLVCLLAHVELRNRWCNDREVQDTLRPLLPQKTVAALIPRASLNQFGRSESLRKGLQEAKELFKLRFTITERGLWRSLWAEDEEQLKNVRRRHSHLSRARLIIRSPDSTNFRTISSPPWIRVIFVKQPEHSRAPATSVPSCSVPCCVPLVSKPGLSVPSNLCLLSPAPRQCRNNGWFKQPRSNHPKPSSTRQQ